MEYRYEENAGCHQEDYSGEERIRGCEQFSGNGVELVNRPHSAEYH